MNTLHTTAIKKASEIRLQLGLNIFEPINIYDICASLNVEVRFVDINMEGLYVNNMGIPNILLSSLRPFPRRSFTCAHELGHHVFYHGLKLDTLTEDESNILKSDDEITADAFAAALLMPIGGIQTEFSKRNWNFQTAQPLDFYVISSLFGVGYSTMIIHCNVNRLINDTKAQELLKFSPARIFKDNFMDTLHNSFFKIIDGKTPLKTIDIELSNYIILPQDYVVESEVLDKKQQTAIGTLYQANSTGIFSVFSEKKDIAHFIRIQPENYTGLAKYRHLDN